MMTRLYVRLALWLRWCAQWLDPLPSEDAAQLALIEQLRADHAAAIDDLEHAYLDHGVEVMELRSMTAAAQTAFATLERVHQHCVPVTHDDLYAEAVALTKGWADREVSGEFKRHQVLAALINTFPERSKRDMALAIEAALWR